MMAQFFWFAAFFILAGAIVCRGFRCLLGDGLSEMFRRREKNGGMNGELYKDSLLFPVIYVLLFFVGMGMVGMAFSAKNSYYDEFSEWFCFWLFLAGMFFAQVCILTETLLVAVRRKQLGGVGFTIWCIVLFGLTIPLCYCLETMWKMLSS